MSSPVRSPPNSRSKLFCEDAPGLQLTVWCGRAVRELHLTARPLPGEPPAETLGRVARLLRSHGAAVVRQEIFGHLQARSQVLGALGQQLGQPTWPVTYIEGAPCGPLHWVGTHLLAVAGGPVETVTQGDHIVGRAYEDGWGRHVWLGNLLPRNLLQPKPEQALQCFRHLIELLRAAGSQATDLVRTWLFLDDIVSWYEAFNGMRTAFYQECGLRDWLPASTGIGGRNAAGAAVCAAAWAVQPRDSAFSIRAVPSPRQCVPTQYGSAFSRAVELTTPELSRLLVSGTASIDPAGRSAHTGDVAAQIKLTMQVVGAILKSRGADFADATRVTAYFKRPEDFHWFDAWRTEAGLATWPVLYVVADVCREELLFELELDALRPVSAA